MTYDAITILSGGMDSTTALYQAQYDGWSDILCLSFDYGQRHRKELEFAARTCAKGGWDHRVITLPLRDLLHGSALTDDIPVPEGHYAAENMAATVVPNRNAIMLSIAWGVATAEHAQVIYTGVHAGDHPIYPDCRPAFIRTMNAAMQNATEGYAEEWLHIEAPFLFRSKADIVSAGDHLGVDWHDTWSCYVGGEHHCGACGTCVERREAFSLAGVVDPTIYLARPEFVAP